MKTRLMMLLACASALFAGGSLADVEKVDGLIWHYQIVNGKAEIYDRTYTAAHDSAGNDPVGILVIPAKLGGKPVAVIGDNAFSGCDGLTAVTIPATVTAIGVYAFNGCDGLTSVKIPDAVTTIGEAAFAGCDSLQCVEFGKKVVSMGKDAFAECEALRSLVFRGNAPGAVGADAFYDVASDCTVYVAKSAKGWPTGGFVSWQGLQLKAEDCMKPVYVGFYDSDMARLGSVSGGGTYAVGKKVTLKATPNKDCVFGGWFEARKDRPFLSFSQSLSYTVTGDDVGIQAYFAYVGADQQLEVETADYEAPDDGYVWIPVGSEFVDSDYLRVISYSEPKLAFKGLPPGVKYDAKKFALVGQATKPGVYKVQVSATNKSVKKATDLSTSEFEVIIPNFVDEQIPVKDSYGPYIPGDFVIQTIPEAAGCSVSGLPPGMKWTAKATTATTPSKVKIDIPANSVYGAATKSADFTAFFTKTVSGVKHMATSTFEIGSFLLLQPDVEGDGTVSGFGAYAANAKIKLTAKANPGSVFRGWFEGGELLSQSPSYTYEMGISDTTITAKFATLDEDRENVKTMLVASDGEVTLKPYTTVDGEAICGVYTKLEIKVDAWSLTTVKVAGLPSGLKFTAKDVVDSKTKEVTVPANSIYGVPTKAGEYNVQITVTTAGKASRLYTIALHVFSIDGFGWVVGQFAGFMVNDIVDAGYGGPVSFTVASNGKISGKFMSSDGKTWTLSAPYFDYYEYNHETDSPVFNATVACKSGNETATMALRVICPEYPMGEPGAGMMGDLGFGEFFMTYWKVEPWKTVGQKINKKKLDMVDVDGKLSMTFSSDGSVKMALDYVTGYKTSCSTTLIPLELPKEDGSFLAELPWCFPANANKNFPGFLDVWMVRWDGSKGAFELVEDDD